MSCRVSGECNNVLSSSSKGTLDPILQQGGEKMYVIATQTRCDVGTALIP